MTQEPAQPTTQQILEPRLAPSPRRCFKDLGEGTLRRIDWQELFPALLLFRAFRVACSPRVLLLALLGIGATTTLAQLVGVDCEIDQSTAVLGPVIPWQVIVGVWREWWFENDSLTFLLGLFAIWGIIGGAIARIAAVKVGCVANTSLTAVTIFLARRLKSFYAAALLIVAGVTLGDAAIRLAFWCLLVPALEQVAAIGFFIPIAISIMMTLLALPLVFGITLLLSAVVTDGADMFDAISRTMSYFYQRIWLYAIYTLVAIGLGFVGYGLMSLITETSVLLLTRTRFPANIDFWIIAVRSLPLAFVVAFFWTSGATIYLLLRRSLDGTTFDTVVD